MSPEKQLRRPDGDQHSGIARFAGAVGLVNLGDGIALVAWAWTASLLTRDPFWIAVLPAALRVPWVLFSLPSGILADRVDRKRLIVFCDVIRAMAYLMAFGAILFALPLVEPSASGLGHPTLYGTLLALGLFVGFAEVTRDNAAQSMLPSIVPLGGLERANGLLGSIELVGNRVAGPAIGAFLIALFLPSPFFVIALALSAAAALTASVAGTFKTEQITATTRHWRREIMNGVRFVAAHPMLRILVLVTGFWTFFSEMALIAMILHVQENLGVSATAYGLILAFGAAGGILGGFLMPFLLRTFRKGTIAKWSNIAPAPLFLLIAFAPGPLAVAVAMFLFFLTSIFWNTVSISYRQREVPDAIMGRVNSVYRLFAWGMMPLGIVASGIVVNVSDAVVGRSLALVVPFFLGAIGIFVVALLSWRPLARGFD